jgi:hypothetical protein
VLLNLCFAFTSKIEMSKSALIFGASGVTGWAFVNEILNDYPKKGIWRKVHALTNRPLKPNDSLWPKDERLNIVSGIDLLRNTQEDLEEALGKIEGIKEVTHVYYLGPPLCASLIRDRSITDTLQHTKPPPISPKNMQTQNPCSAVPRSL